MIGLTGVDTRSASAADCPLSYAGLTVYATVDVGVGVGFDRG